jgi:undecaprenyl-diphosphatase
MIAMVQGAGVVSPLHAAVLGAIQGITEFLPISSSAHLFVVPTLLGWPYGGLAFDVALHWGTLLALVAATGGEWWRLARDALAGGGEQRAAAWRLILKLAAASVPAAIAGLLLEDAASTALRSPPLQAATLAIFGFLLWWVDRASPPGTEPREPGWGACLVVGAAQALALVPGVSRSGVTITAGRALGLSRVGAARFSFLLATPITFGAGLLELRHLSSDLSPVTLAVGVIAAAVTGFLAIHGLIRWLGRAGFGVFFAYRAALAVLILVVLARR